jgi:hypothetical protein
VTQPDEVPSIDGVIGKELSNPIPEGRLTQ